MQSMDSEDLELVISAIRSICGSDNFREKILKMLVANGDEQAWELIAEFRESKSQDVLRKRIFDYLDSIAAEARNKLH